MVWAFATFVLANLVALASPGPAFFAISYKAVNDTRRQALSFGLGLAFVATFWCALALFGLTTVFDYVPWLYGALKVAGGLYLLYLAFKIWSGAATPLAESPQSGQKGGWAFLSGCLINATNPKSALFAGSVLLAIFPMDLTGGQQVLILSAMFATEALFYSAIVLWLSQPAMRLRYLQIKRWIDRSAAAVLGALGLSFVLYRS